MKARILGATNQSRTSDPIVSLSWEWLRFAFTAALERVLVWHERIVARDRLSALDDHMLKDIGVSRFEVEAECRKPFWKA